MNKDEGRREFYGMSFEEWKERYQTDADPSKMEAFKKAHEESVQNKLI